MTTFQSPSDYLPVLIQSVVAIGFVVVTLVVSHLVTLRNKRVRALRKDENFECGIEVKGNARFPFSVKYFLVAILFVLFDVEIIFFYPWAINFLDMGWKEFFAMLLFLLLFMTGFYYILKKGALEWDKDE